MPDMVLHQDFNSATGDEATTRGWIMPAGLRKLMLTAHVTSSVGWLGAVLAFLALAVIGMTSQDAPTVRGVYLVMQPAAWYVLVPLAFVHAVLALLVLLLVTALGVYKPPGLTPFGRRRVRRQPTV